MSPNSVFRKKNLENLLAEMAGEHRLKRVLGPVSLTALAIGAIIGAGIFVTTGRVAAEDAGPAIVLSYTVAAIGCALAALCYAEFAAMAPVAGSAYTYAYTTLGEIFAWIIGWDLILEYAMSCATVASAWPNYLNELLGSLGLPTIPGAWCTDPFTYVPGTETRGIMNLPGALILFVITALLVLGIRESARANAVLVLIKLGVVVFVIALGISYVSRDNWLGVPVSERVLPEASVVPDVVRDELARLHPELKQDPAAFAERASQVGRELRAAHRLESARAEIAGRQEQGTVSQEEAQKLLAAAEQRAAPDLPQTDADRQMVDDLLPPLRERGKSAARRKWGLLGVLGLDRWLAPLDDATRSPFFPYGLSGIMVGASIVFFAYIGFDSISTNAEEAINPQRDLPLGIIVSLVVCTVLYIGVAAVITGMVPYPDIDIKAAVAVAFSQKAEHADSSALRWAAGLIAAGGVAGMTSVLLVTFLSQARVFLAMARDGLMPPIFKHVHPKYGTPHLATMLTGAVITVVAAVSPIHLLTEMVNIGTLMAFVMVAAAVLVLRWTRPDAERPFRCPAVFVVAPVGIAVNLLMMLFLPGDTWLRLVIWLAIGLAIYFLYGYWHSHLGRELVRELAEHGLSPTDAPLPKPKQD
ncbi:MAG: amino acid permease [Pirellulales bacterium]|nr:amino acid permease [Pirellulales bacterium]